MRVAPLVQRSAGRTWRPRGCGTVATLVTASYWQRDAGWRDRYRDTPLPARVDIAVIGGGFAGLATAIRIRERRPDAQIVVLEAERVGYGASGRNAGLLSPLAAPVWLLAREHAWAAVRIHDEMHAVARWIAGTIPSSELAPARLGLVARDRIARGALHEFVRAVDRTGLPHTTTDGALEMAAYTVHPYALVCGLAEHAIQQGVTIVEGARVRSIRGTQLVLDDATVDASRIVVCTNAYTGSLELGESLRALVVHGFMTASEPLDPQERARLQRAADFVVEVNVAGAYHRMHRDRLVYGGIDALRAPPSDFAVPPRIRASLDRHLQSSFPHARVPVAEAWSGRFHATVTGLPIVRRARNPAIVLDVGYGGTGVTLSLVCARLAAALACDDVSPDDARLLATLHDTRISVRDAARAVGGILGRIAMPWRT